MNYLLFSKVKTTCNLQRNLDVLGKEMGSLRDRRADVRYEVEAAEREGNAIRAQVSTWLENEENLQSRAYQILEEKPSACFLNCCKRYKKGKEVEKILEEIERLRDAVSFPSGKPTTMAVDHIPVPSIRSQTTASKALAETMRLLYDERVRRIGIWGLGGIGKTTLVKNLNNELSTTLRQPFGIVIWATVSKNLDMRQVQTQIAQRLNLEVKMGESTQEMAIQLHRRLKNVKTFLLILDDVWENIDLDNLGVPQTDVHYGYKIILTSRSREVCRNMETDVDVKMDVLNDEEAWQLFCQKAGDVVDLKQIRPFAQATARECCGLPLAIITVGIAMRRKTMVGLWDYALKELRRSVPSVEGIEDKVYKPLKWSYDSLQGNDLKSCFLYCSLFPKDFSIKISELVQCWLAEGLIDEQQNHVDSVNTGIALIEKLKDSCLLEDGADEGTVRMHGVVRDVAIWIASSPEDGCKSLVRSGIGLSEISVGDFSNSNSLKRVSFMNNNITRLPDCVIEQCSEASTLLLQENEFLEAVPDRFLQGFAALRVLNLSSTRIQSLPHSLLHLRDLGALHLRYCKYLKELPPLGGLSRLQILDLRGSSIRELPDGMENLSNLRQLDLSCTMNLKAFQVGILSRLSCLEVLDVTYIAYGLLGMGMEEEEQTAFEELRCLDRLLFLSISFKRIPHLSSEDLFLVNRLRGFQIFIDPKRGFNSVIGTTNNKGVSFCNVDFSQESIGQLWGIAESLVLNDCRGLDEMLEDLVIKSVECFTGLKSLAITVVKSFDRRVRVIGGLAAQRDLLPNLEELTLSNLNVLESVSELVGYLGLRFLRLKSIDVSDCSDMKYLFSCGDFIRILPNLEVIKVSNCCDLHELFNYDSGQIMAPHPVVPMLRTLELQSLPTLRSLCRHEETWPCLEQVKVLQCEELRRLPLSWQNAGTIKEIEGESEWWDALEWDDYGTKSSLLSYFRPTLPKF